MYHFSQARIGTTVALLLCMQLGTIAQSRKTDSLREVVSRLSGTERADALNTLSFYLLNFDTKLFRATSAEAFQISRKLGYQKGIAEASLLSGINEFTAGNTTLSGRYMHEGIRISREINEKGLEGYGYTQLGINFHYEDQPDSAIWYFTKSYAVLKDSLHPYYLSRVYLGFADYYGLRGERSRQLSYLNKCLRIREMLKDGTESWLLVKIAGYYSDQHEQGLAIKTLEEATRLNGGDTSNNETISEIKAQLAIVYFRMGNYNRALALFYSAKKFYETNDRKQELANLLLNIGRVFDSMGNYDLSLRNYFEALGITDSNHFTLETIQLEYAIAWSYLRLNQPDLAQKYATGTLRRAQKNHHPSETASALDLMGMIKGRQNKNTEALADLKKAKAIRIRLQDNIGLAKTMFNIGTLYEKQNMLDSSLYYQSRSLAIREKYNDEEAMADSWQLMGRLFMKLGNYQKATGYLDKAEVLSKKLHISYVLLNTYETRRELLKTQLLFEKALEYSLLYENLRDSIFNTNLSSRLSILENINRFQEKEQQIQMLSQQKKLQEQNLLLQAAQIRSQRLLIMLIGVALLIVGSGAVTMYRYYSKVRSLNREITQQNREIGAQKMEIEAQSEELVSSNETISAINQSLELRILERTDELKQAYRELDTFFYRASHDFRRPLTTFMGLAEVAKITIRDESALELFEKVNDTARSLDKMLVKLQSISDVGAHELDYRKVSMKTIFETEAEKFKTEIIKGNITVEIQASEDDTFISSPALLHIIVNNLLENAVTFTNKVNPGITLKSFQRKGMVVLEVDDNGEGISEEWHDKVFEMYFRASDRSKGNGLGLYVVQKIAQKLNGRVEMTSAPLKGTSVRVIFPPTVVG